MKWIKFDPENPPSGVVLFRFEIEDGIMHLTGYFRWPSCVLYAAEFKFFTITDMKKYNAHWIYPQDIGIPS